MKKIAIIDDEMSMLDILKSYLSRRDFLTIDVYTSASDSLHKLLSGEYDLIISDITMPDMTGLQLLEYVREKMPSQKVILMTADSSEERIIKSYNLKAEDYLTKPFISLRDVENKIMDNLGM